jgi:hypothetical protein
MLLSFSTSNQATGSYFVTGKAKSKLDAFLTYFQRYLFTRGYVPPSTEYEVPYTTSPTQTHSRTHPCSLLPSDRCLT